LTSKSIGHVEVVSDKFKSTVAHRHIIGSLLPLSSESWKIGSSGVDSKERAVTVVVWIGDEHGSVVVGASGSHRAMKMKRCVVKCVLKIVEARDRNLFGVDIDLSGHVIEDSRVPGMGREVAGGVIGVDRNASKRVYLISS